jgi:hypothetical protein
MAKQTENTKKPEPESFAAWMERMTQMGVRNLNKNAKASVKAKGRHSVQDIDSR